MDILKPLLSSSTTPATPAASVSPFTRVSSLLESLQPAADHKLLLQHVATPVATALVGPVQQGSAPAEASSLLASVVKRFGAEVVVGGASAVLPGGGRTTGSFLLFVHQPRRGADALK